MNNLLLKINIPILFKSSTVKMTSPSSSFDSDDLPLALSAKRRKILSTASSNERNSPLNIYGVPGPSSDNVREDV